ncbi:MAG: hypothetical protein Q8L68_02395 [Methylococcales bacterium]|nr:hypothetical protein [Methylococcales bacterium]
METSKKNHLFQVKRPRLIQKISLGVILGLIFTGYFGFCWGWLGRSSLFLQFFFQCSCPISGNQFRYDSRVKVIVPACEHKMIRLSPSGRLLLVNDEDFGKDKIYILDLATGNKQYIAASSNASIHFLEMPYYFLNDSLIFHTYHGVNEYIYDWTSQKEYQIQKYEDLHPAYLFGDESRLDALVDNLKNASQIYLIGNDIIVALSSNVQDSYTLNDFDIFIDPHEENVLEEFLKKNTITYTYLPDFPQYPTEYVSFDNEFIARTNGIYLSKTNQRIVDGYPNQEFQEVNDENYFNLFGWIYDNTGAIYADPFGSCFVRYWLPGMDGSSCLARVSQPVLKLVVPQEYLNANQ